MSLKQEFYDGFHGKNIKAKTYKGTK